QVGQRLRRGGDRRQTARPPVDDVEFAAIQRDVWRQHVQARRADDQVVNAVRVQVQIRYARQETELGGGRLTFEDWLSQDQLVLPLRDGLVNRIEQEDPARLFLPDDRPVDRVADHDRIAQVGDDQVGGSVAVEVAGGHLQRAAQQGARVGLFLAADGDVGGE